MPVVLWMGVIFLASTDIGSSQHTGRIIRPFLKWLKPDVTEETIKAVQTAVRKTGHVSEYAVLAAWVWRARRVTAQATAWTRREFAIVIGVCAAYASSDEFHQLFVSSRQASVIDVLIDTIGATVGLLLVWFIFRRRRRESEPPIVGSRKPQPSPL